MIYLGVIVGLGILGGMVFLALNRKSTGTVRVASIIAIALMLITIIICLAVVLTGRKEVAVDYSNLIVGAPVEVQEVNSGNFIVLVFLILILIALFIFLVIQSKKEYNKMKDGSFKDLPKTSEW